MKVLQERVEAMQAIWTQHEASYSGEFVHFERIWSYPKPAQRPHPPVLVGGDGPTVLDRVLAFGDAWFPNYQPLAAIRAPQHHRASPGSVGQRNRPIHRRMTDQEARRRFAQARVARLATTDTHHRPHIVPMIFARQARQIPTRRIPLTRFTAPSMRNPSDRHHYAGSPTSQPTPTLPSSPTTTRTTGTRCGGYGPMVPPGSSTPTNPRAATPSHD
jgi:alkanesulfonate monooxygenase SsuD/methylene tetrahydromethanopterin reductase-like flavin-dependent oxidoreductase (luciferase family)